MKTLQTDVRINRKNKLFSLMNPSNRETAVSLCCSKWLCPPRKKPYWTKKCVFTSNANFIIDMSRLHYKVNAKTRMEVNLRWATQIMWLLRKTCDIRLKCVFHISWKISNRVENQHGGLSRKPISKVLTDMSGLNRKWRRALNDDFICASDTKNILRVI